MVFSPSLSFALSLSRFVVIVLLFWLCIALAAVFDLPFESNSSCVRMFAFRLTCVYSSRLPLRVLLLCLSQLALHGIATQQHSINGLHMHAIERTHGLQNSGFFLSFTEWNGYKQVATRLTTTIQHDTDQEVSWIQLQLKTQQIQASAKETSW